MRIFLLDDSDALGRYISNVKPADAHCDVFCVEPSYYGKRESLDDFFHAILMEDAWRMAGDVQGGESDSLKSLMGNASDEYLFLIHVNLKPTKFSTRQDQEGIELLKHIRLTGKDDLGEGRHAHVVLYSFEDQLELLKRKPGNLIMLSEGVTFLRLPDGLNTFRDIATLTDLSSQKPGGVHLQVASQTLRALPASLIQAIQTRWRRLLAHELQPGKPFAAALREASGTIASDGIATEAQRTALTRAWLEVQQHLYPVPTGMDDSVADLLPLIQDLDDWVQKACRRCLDLAFTPNAGLNCLEKIVISLLETESSLR